MTRDDSCDSAARYFDNEPGASGSATRFSAEDPDKGQSVAKLGRFYVLRPYWLSSSMK